MSNELFLLFNQFSDMNVKTICSVLNQKIERRELKYSERRAFELLNKREAALLENHLIDFSIDVQEILVSMLSQSQYVSLENFFQITIDLQELFYFLRSNVESEFDDYSLIEKVVAVFQQKGGSLNSTQGFFEEWLIERRLSDDQIIKKNDESE